MSPFKVLGLDVVIQERDLDLLIVACNLSNNSDFSWPKVLKKLGEIIEPEKIVIIPGNYDYYAFRLDGADLFREMCTDAGICFAQKEDIWIGKTYVLSCALWPTFQLVGNEQAAMRQDVQEMNDYKLIKTAEILTLPFDQESTRRIRPADTIILHQGHLARLTAAL